MGCEVREGGGVLIYTRRPSRDCRLSEFGRDGKPGVLKIRHQRSKRGDIPTITPHRRYGTDSGRSQGYVGRFPPFRLRVRSASRAAQRLQSGQTGLR